MTVPALRNPSTGGTDWYHGTRASSGELSGGFRVTAYDRVAEASGHWASHWSALLGVHFAADHSAAEEFARPGSGVGGAAGAPGPRSTPSVVHARLLISPKVYGSEHDMADDAFEYEHGTRRNYISRNENASRAARTYFSFDDRPDERPDRGEWEDFHGWDKIGEWGEPRPGPVYRRAQWLTLHPDKAGIVERFRQRLISQGYDGIVYGNEEPAERVRSGRPEPNTAAVAFFPRQIEIVSHHRLGDEHAPAVREPEPAYEHDAYPDGVHWFSAQHPEHGEIAYALVLEKDGPGGPHAEIANLRTAPEHRGRGIATRLLENAGRQFPGRELRLKPFPADDDDTTAEDLEEYYANRGFEHRQVQEGDPPGLDGWMRKQAAGPRPHEQAPSPAPPAAPDGADTRLLDSRHRLRPAAREAVTGRLAAALQTAGPDWRTWVTACAARPADSGPSALDVLVTVDCDRARASSPDLAALDDVQIEQELNQTLRAHFNLNPPGTWTLSGRVTPAVPDLTGAWTSWTIPDRTETASRARPWQETGIRAAAPGSGHGLGTSAPGLGTLYHSTPYGSGFPFDEWIHAGDLRAAEERAAYARPGDYGLPADEPARVHAFRLRGRVYPKVLDEEIAIDIWGSGYIDEIDDGYPPGRGYHVFPYANTSENPGHLSFLVHRSAIVPVGTATHPRSEFPFNPACYPPCQRGMLPVEEAPPPGPAVLPGSDLSRLHPRAEWVKTDALLAHREFIHLPGFTISWDAARFAPRHTPAQWEAGARSVAARGISEDPVRLLYDPARRTAYVGEGNSQLAWAVHAGHEAVPAVVHRTPDGMDHPQFNVPGALPGPDGRLPRVLRPSHVLPPDYLWHPRRTPAAAAPSRARAAGRRASAQGQHSPRA